MYRQGDLSFKLIKKLPAGKTKKVTSVVLAEGEHTGHKHLLAARPEVDIEILKSVDKLYFKIEGGKATLTHEEHNVIEFEPGIYEMQTEREYDYFLEGVRAVID